jgi:TrmH family RNA methyltransferase
MPVVAASLESTQAWLRRNGIRVIAATPHSSELYHATDMTGPTAIVVGTEQEGLSESWSAFADTSVRLPMRGKADSLNVAAAAAVLLYEAVRQRA